MNRGVSRETCRVCFQANPVGFHVPDDIWIAVSPCGHKTDVLCISCFARIADEKLIPWDKQIELFPVSLATHHGL